MHEWFEHPHLMRNEKIKKLQSDDVIMGKWQCNLLIVRTIKKGGEEWKKKILLNIHAICFCIGMRNICLANWMRIVFHSGFIEMKTGKQFWKIGKTEMKNI